MPKLYVLILAALLLAGCSGPRVPATKPTVKEPRGTTAEVFYPEVEYSR